MQNEMYSKYALQYAEAIKDNIYNARLDRPSLLSLCPLSAEHSIRQIQLSEGELLANTPYQGKKVLDLACGPGLYSQHFLALGAKVTAIDISPEMVALIQQTSANRVKAYCHDMALGLPMVEDNSVDLVICPLAIHYVEDLSILFQEVARVLKPDACFVLSTHHPMADYDASPSKNYYCTELIEQDWDTIGHKVAVRFYRRPLTELIATINRAGMYLDTLNEGVLCDSWTTEMRAISEVKKIAPDTYTKLTQTPAFIFIRCKLRNE